MNRTGILGLYLLADGGSRHLTLTMDGVEEAEYEKIVAEMRAKRPKAKLAVVEGANRRLGVRLDRISMVQFVPDSQPNHIRGGTVENEDGPAW